MKFKIILSSVLILSFIFGSFIMYILFPNDRIYYKIYEENGQYYYIDYWDKWMDYLGIWLGYYSESYEKINGKIWIEFEDGLALIHESKILWGSLTSDYIWKYIDRKGKVVLVPKVYYYYINDKSSSVYSFYYADAYSEGLAAVAPEEGPYWGYMNKKGEIVIEPQYRSASMFKDGFASVENDNGKWILINNKGEYIRDLDEPLNWKSYVQCPVYNNTIISKWECDTQ